MAAALHERALSIGGDPRDTADERFRKRLLVGVALLILPVAFAWGCVYWAFGEHGVALTPWAYVAGSVISLAVFARTRSFAFLRTALNAEVSGSSTRPPLQSRAAERSPHPERIQLSDAGR